MVDYEVLEKTENTGYFGTTYQTKFKCASGKIFVASETVDPISSEVAILNEDMELVSDPIRRISTVEAIKLWCRGKWEKGGL